MTSKPPNNPTVNTRRLNYTAEELSDLSEIEFEFELARAKERMRGLSEREFELQRVQNELVIETGRAQPNVARLQQEKNEFSHWHSRQISDTRAFVRRLSELD